MAVYDNLGGGEDITAITEAIESKGVIIPTGASAEEVAALIANNLFVPPKTQSGTYEYTTKINANSSGDIVITFPEPFAKVPEVSFAARKSDSSGEITSTTLVTLKSVTTGSFVVTASPGGSSFYETYIDWSATAEN